MDWESKDNTSPNPLSLTLSRLLLLAQTARTLPGLETCDKPMACESRRQDKEGRFDRCVTRSAGRPDRLSPAWCPTPLPLEQISQARSQVTVRLDEFSISLRLRTKYQHQPDRPTLAQTSCKGPYIVRTWNNIVI